VFGHGAAAWQHQSEDHRNTKAQSAAHGKAVDYGTMREKGKWHERERLKFMAKVETAGPGGQIFPMHAQA
jgi:hypothetical protein